MMPNKINNFANRGRVARSSDNAKLELIGLRARLIVFVFRVDANGFANGIYFGVFGGIFGYKFR